MGCTERSIDHMCHGLISTMAAQLIPIVVVTSPIKQIDYSIK